MVRALGVLALLILASCQPEAAEPPPIARTNGDDLPLLTGRVVDNADLLSPDKEAEIVRTLKALEDRTTDQFVVVTLPSLRGRAIEEVGRALGNGWGIGQKGKGNGVLLVVAPTERKVRIEVGRGLERVLTNALCATFIRRDIVPRFRNGDMQGGIMAGVTDIVSALEPAADLRKAA